MKMRVIVPLVVGAILALMGPLQGQKKTDPIVGMYDWWNDSVVVIRKDGTATTRWQGKYVAGRWVVNPYGGYVIMWESGSVDCVKLTPNGKKVAGTGVTDVVKGKAQTISGTKQKK